MAVQAIDCNIYTYGTRARKRDLLSRKCVQLNNFYMLVCWECINLFTWRVLSQDKKLLLQTTTFQDTILGSARASMCDVDALLYQPFRAKKGLWSLTSSLIYLLVGVPLSSGRRRRELHGNASPSVNDIQYTINHVIRRATRQPGITRIRSDTGVRPQLTFLFNVSCRAYEIVKWELNKLTLCDMSAFEQEYSQVCF